MSNLKNIKVNFFEEDTRIDKWLKRKFPLLTHSYIEKSLRIGSIKVNKLKIKANYKVLVGDIVNIYSFNKTIFSNIKILKKKKFISKETLKKFNNSIIYENTDFIILNKWEGISTQGANKSDLSINNIISDISKNYSLVHRIDKDTSGLLIISKNYKSAKIFGELFKKHLIEKIYYAVCEGNPKYLSSIVDLNLNKKNSNQKYNTITSYKLLDKLKHISFIIFKPLTGKKHQIRIVSKNLNCPIIGDKKYNYNSRYKIQKLMLNAFYLKFKFNNKTYEFNSITPEHISIFLKKINFKIPKNKKILTFSKTF